MMTTRPRHGGQRRPSRPPDGVLLCMAVDGPHWAEQIPPVPGHFDVTVSLSASAVAAGHADALEALGYRPVGTDRSTLPVAAGTAGSSAQFLIANDAIDNHPTWYRALATRAERAFNLSMGPAASTLAPLLQLHLEPLRRAAQD